MNPRILLQCLAHLAVVGGGLLLGIGESANAGPYDELGIPAQGGEFRVWGADVWDYTPALGVEANDVAANALGPSDGRTVSLGDLSQLELSSGAAAGSITLQFDEAIRNGPGWDFAVFENAFAISGEYVFAELGFVEVSTDGNTFARFESVSLTEERLNLPMTAFSGIDPTDVANLAGKHASGYGTPFDVDELKLSSAVTSGDVKLHDIRFVRIVDVPGSASVQEPLLNASGEIAFADSMGNPILDPWNTMPTGVAGFDLDAIGGRYVRDASYVELIRENMFESGTDLWSGDLNADGVTDGSDFNLWNAVDFVDPRPSRTIVPEPKCATLLWLTILLSALSRKRT